MKSFPHAGNDIQRVQVKICGITSDDDARACVMLGADALGINFWPRSKRYAEPGSVAGWLRDLEGMICRIGVFVNEDAARVEQLFADGLIDIAQFHGDENRDFCHHFSIKNLPFIKAFGVKDPDSLKDIARYHTDTVLLDAWCPETYGGSGATCDWDLAAGVIAGNPSLRVILAGGLTADNVAEAVKATSPAAVDVASGVEASPGVKDLQLVEKFIEEAKG